MRVSKERIGDGGAASAKVLRPRTLDRKARARKQWGEVIFVKVRSSFR